MKPIWEETLYGEGMAVGGACVRVTKAQTSSALGALGLSW